MTGVDLRQFRDYIVVPALQAISLYTKAAERLVLATALAESGLRYIDQADKSGRPGPAYGFFQMEGATHDDLWENFLPYQGALWPRVEHLLLPVMDRVQQLQGNAYYAAAMCRVHYLRIKKPLPASDDLAGIAQYWKRYYNTELGKGTVEGFMQKAAPVMAL